MKRLALVLLLLGFTTLVFAEDRVRVQVQFRKALWTCPGGNEITDLNVGTPSVYEHACSDGTWLNKFTEYNGFLTYSPIEYELADSVEKAAAKKLLVDKWIYDREHPAPYVEPLPAEYDKMIAEKEAEIQSLQMRKAEAIAKLPK